MKNTPDEFNEFVSKNVPLGRIGQVKDVADLAFLTATSGFGNYLTGARINIDGGTSLISWGFGQINKQVRDFPVKLENII